MNTLMACGHSANAMSGNLPVCAICIMTTPDAVEIATETPDLTGRMARCGCKAMEPSSVKLPFFQYRGPGSHAANDSCKNCGYALAAHDPESMARNVPSNRRTVLEQGKCSGFEPHGAFEFDSYYCLCRGTE